jgi:uncharacterized protein (TIGR00290 family)
MGHEGTPDDLTAPADAPAPTPADPADVVVAWSGGKDAASLLWRLLDRDDVAVVELLTTAADDRTKAHRLRRDLVERQADALGLPLRFVELPPDPDNETYEAGVHAALSAAAERGIDRVAYGDLLLEDVRDYREGLVEGTGLAGWWPIWGTDTGTAAREFLDAGFAARLVAVNDDALDADFAGMTLEAALAEAPEDVDPCGEHGEFHTFVTDGPIFDHPVPVEPGEVTSRDGRHAGATIHYQDLVPVD